MKAVVSSELMKAFDSYTIDKIGLSQDVLMERAALYAFDHIASVAGEGKNNILVACGPGNNGGDGLALARLLYFHGLDVKVFMPQKTSKLSAGCIRQLEICKNIGIEVINDLPQSCDIVVDALFGVGLTRNIDGEYADIVRALNSYSGYKVALDIPSGINSDTGQVMGLAFEADVTVSFGLIKQGQLLYPGRSFCGRLLVGDIGIYPNSDVGEVSCFTLEQSDICELLPPRKVDSNKGTYGRALIIAGSNDMAGAAVLAAKAAYLSGAGLVNVFTSESCREIVLKSLPEAVLTTYNDNDYKDKLVNAINSATSVLVGPGLGQSQTSADIVRITANYARQELVMDADALNILAQDNDIINNIKTSLTITPHMKEMSRLSGKSINELKSDRCTMAADYAKANNMTVVMKDACTVIAYPNGDTFINTSGNPGMSTAGSGDVLAGLLAGLLAQGVKSNVAPQLAVFIHGFAGDIAAKIKGLHGLMASDIADALPIAMGVSDGKI